MKVIRLKIEDTKAAEIAVIAKLVVSFQGTGLYLESLFTPAFLMWVGEQIKNDFPPDIHSYLLTDEDRHKYNEQIAMLDTQVTELIRQKDLVTNELARVRDEADKVEVYYKDALARELDEKSHYSRHNAQLAHEINQLHEECSKLQDEVMRLKAHLYDLTEQADRTPNADLRRTDA